MPRVASLSLATCLLASLEPVLVAPVDCVSNGHGDEDLRTGMSYS